VLRAAALTALERLLGGKSADEARAGLKDRDERVRLAAARALGAHAPREALGPLVELLEADALPVRADAAAGLAAMTGRPPDFAAYDPADRRKEAVARWRAWRKEHGETAKLTPLPRDLRPAPTRLLLCLFSPNRVVELDLAGKEVFAAEGMAAACGCAGLADGRRFFADWGTRELVEMDRAGKVTARGKLPGTPNSLDRLPDGHTLIGLFDVREVCELKPDGDVAWRARVDGAPTDARRLADGHTLVALFNVDRLVELDRDGKVVWQVEKVPSPESARRLASGNTLTASSRTGQVLEYSPAGKLVWSVKDLPSAYDALELENGHILVGYLRGLREIDRDGKLIREFPVGTVRRICRY
jgi:hypothetical protein